MVSEQDITAIKARTNPAEDSRLDDEFASIAEKLKPTTITFSNKEEEILDLYDALEGLRLENAMMEAQIAQGSEIDIGADSKTMVEAERDHLEARAAWSLSDNIVKNVLQVDPLLKAIHSGENASPMERSLQPLIDQRDVLALVQTNLSKRLQSITDDLILVRTLNLDLTSKNRALSTNIVQLGKQSELTADKIEDVGLKERLGVLRSKTKEEKRQYRIIKSLASGIIAGSGFDWAVDDELCSIVHDDED